MNSPSNKDPLVSLKSQTAHKWLQNDIPLCHWKSGSFVVSGMRQSSTIHLSMCIIAGSLSKSERERELASLWPSSLILSVAIAIHLYFCKSYRVRQDYVPLTKHCTLWDALFLKSVSVSNLTAATVCCSLLNPDEMTSQ